MSRAAHTPDESHTSKRATDDAARLARQAPDAKQRAIEHGAEEYYRREGSPAESERAGRPFIGGDAEVPEEVPQA